MRSRMKFSPNFFLMQHTALLYCHKGCVFTVKQPNALSIKAYWHKVCSWFIDKYSGDVIWKMFEQVDSSRKHFKDGKISLSSLSFIFLHIFICHLTLFLTISIILQHLCKQSHLPSKLVRELLRNVYISLQRVFSERNAIQNLGLP